MGTSIPLPTGSYALPEPRASCKRLVNCFAESSPQDTVADVKDQLSPIILRRAPGIVPWAQTEATITQTQTFTITAVTLTGVYQGLTLLYAYYTVTVSGNLPGTFVAGTQVTIAGVSYTGTATGLNATNQVASIISNNSFTFNIPGGQWGSFTYASGGTFSNEIPGGPAAQGCRGLHMMQGILYTVIGSNLYQVGSDGTLTVLGTGIAYSGLVRMSDNGYCLVIIIPYTTTGYYYIPNIQVTLELETAPMTSDTTLTLQGNFPYVSGTYNFTLQGNINPTISGVATQGTLANPSTTVNLNTAVPSGTYTATVVITFPGNFAQITDSTFTSLGAIDCGFIDTYVVFLQSNGKGFYNSDSTSISSNGPVTFSSGAQFLREYGTDPFVAMMIDHRTVCMLGQLTTELFLDTGTQTGIGTPFSDAPNNFMQIGAATNLAIAQQDQSYFWIANDRTVRRQEGLTPQRVSNHGIESILEQADLTGAYAFPYSIGGHLMVAFTLPGEKRTIVYDCTTTQWHEMSSLGFGQWRVTCAINAYGYWIVGDSTTGQLGYLDTNVKTEFGNVRPSQWIHQTIYQGHQRIRHQRLEIVMGTGAASTPESLDPVLTLEISDDGGNLFRTMRSMPLGTTGNYNMRATWWRLGMARDRVYRFTLSDPVELWVTDAQLDVLPAKN